MPRQCYSCKATKELKSIFIEDCDCHTDLFKKPEFHSVCKSCYFESCTCGYEMHQASECLDDKTCENNKQTKSYFDNWNNYNYHWRLKQ